MVEAHRLGAAPPGRLRPLGWRSQDDPAAQWQLETDFRAAMPRERAAELMEAWERAVRQATQH